MAVISGATALASRGIEAVTGQDILGGGLFGQPQQQTSSQTVEIPDFLRGLSEQQADVAGSSLTRLQGLLGSPQISRFNQDEQMGLDLARQQATTGDAIPAAINQFQQTAQGDFLNSDAFNNAFQSALRQAQPEISSRFALSGRLGSGLESTAQTQAAANAFGSLFNAERNRQLQAAGQLPDTALAPARILQNIGGIQRQREVQSPIAAQQQLQQAAGGPIGLGNFLGQQQMTPQTGQSPLMAGLGGAATGASIGSVVPGLGTGFGAIGGGLLGLLSGGR